MECNNFVDFPQGLNFRNLATPVNTDRNKFSWLNIQESKYKKCFFGFQFYYNLEDNYRTCLLGPKEPRQKKMHSMFTEPPLLHPQLTAPKVLDLMKLMTFISLTYQGFC